MDSKNGKAVYIIDGARTPFLKAKGRPGPFHAVDLAFHSGRALLSRQPFLPSDLDEVIVGCVIPGANEANIARVLALRLGCGKLVPAWTVQRNCASGLQALDSAFKDIETGRANLVLAGGTEAMSRAPLQLNDKMVSWLADWQRAKGFPAKLRQLSLLRPRHFSPVITLICGLTDPNVGLSMGETAEILAERFSISREEMDEYSMESHKRLAGAQDDGSLSEIVGIFDTSGKYFDKDEGLRRETDMTSLGKLKPVFDRKVGTVTAGNSSQVTDGAAMILLAGAEAVKKHNLKVLAKIIDVQWSGLDPAQMGLGPAHSVAALLKKNGLAIQEIDYWEINEAFSAQVLACLRALNSDDYCKNELGLGEALGKIESSTLNLHGGGISLGHPIGASGARIVLHLANVLSKRGGKRGVASLCIGGGQGGAMLIEREDDYGRV
ncbi:MAG: acetyl-CoA C-acetyltransferase [Nitrospinota bacterium]